jgi:hypothetical protein
MYVARLGRLNTVDARYCEVLPVKLSPTATRLCKVMVERIVVFVAFRGDSRVLAHLAARSQSQKVQTSSPLQIYNNMKILYKTLLDQSKDRARASSHRSFSIIHANLPVLFPLFHIANDRNGCNIQVEGEIKSSTNKKKPNGYKTHQ